MRWIMPIDHGIIHRELEPGRLYRLTAFWRNSVPAHILKARSTINPQQTEPSGPRPEAAYATPFHPISANIRPHTGWARGWE